MFRGRPRFFKSKVTIIFPGRESLERGISDYLISTLKVRCSSNSPSPSTQDCL